MPGCNPSVSPYGKKASDNVCTDRSERFNSALRLNCVDKADRIVTVCALRKLPDDCKYNGSVNFENVNETPVPSADANGSYANEVSNLYRFECCGLLLENSFEVILSLS